ncbi:PAS domain S-box protein [Hymenobacter sediminis]|uniref:PAS domain-containing sensor histidine kinase n=1 Tax=Hymenobacter sediminis TaxID=2218621 RepID=UPI000DA65B88|nr:PAS domain S-box protein [Hymenobacter sediminis]RPD45709.1 PAS domain S-box protein [Hymenobacter sediminis]
MSPAAPLDSLTLLAVFHALPSAYLLLSPEYIIEEVSNGYLAETQTERAQLLGCYLFDAFPDNPQAQQAHGVRNLRASLERVLATGLPHQMDLQHYDVPDSQQPGQFLERYWLPTNTPIFDAEGRISHLLHRVVNVTEQQQAQAQLGESQRREQAAQAHANQLVRATIDSSMAIIQVFDAVRDEAGRIVDFRWTLVNKQAAAQYNTDLVGQRLLALNPGVVATGIFARFVQVVENGQPQVYEQEYRHEQYNGWFEQSVVRLGDGVVSTTTDITDRKRAEEALRAAHARTVDILESTTDAFYALDADFNFTYVNQRAARLWGRDRDELLGCHYWTEFPAAVGSESYSLHYQVQQTGQPAQYEIVSPRLGTWIDVSIYPGTAGSLSVFFRDITARKNSEEALRRSEERLRQAFSIETVGVIFFDSAGRIHAANQAFQRLSGYVPAAFPQGHVHWDALTPPEFLAMTRQAQQELLAHGQSTPYEQQCQRPDGTRWWGLFAGKRLSEEEYVAFVLDITERKQATSQLQAFNEQLQRANTDLDNFIYTASHDLRAPIANIEGLLLALQRELPATAYVDQVPTVLGLMQDAVDRFSRTIGHLTDISRLQQEYGQPATPVQVAPVVHEVLLDLAPLITQTDAQVTITIPEQVWLTISEKNLRSVVYNLLSNALKYRHPNRTPQIRISCQPKGSYQVLAVQDNGLGLDLTQGDAKVFGMFQRLHTHVEGTGIGLYMVKKMLENIGGRIEVQSQPGEGTTFHAYFPVL